MLAVQSSFQCNILYFRYDELRDLIRTVKNSQNIKDVAKVLSGWLLLHGYNFIVPFYIDISHLGFETLQKAFVKAKNVVEKEGGTPTFYIRALVGMEDFVTQVSTM